MLGFQKAVRDLTVAVAATTGLVRKSEEDAISLGIMRVRRYVLGCVNHFVEQRGVVLVAQFRIEKDKPIDNYAIDDHVSMRLAKMGTLAQGTNNDTQHFG